MSLACPNCGSSPDPRDLFCGTCGHPVRVHAAQTAGSTATSADGRAQWSGRGTSRISQAAPADGADQSAYPQRPVRDHRQASPDVPPSTSPSSGARSSRPFTERSAPMENQHRNAGFPGRNAAFPGLPDGGTPNQSSEQPAAVPETGSGQFSWSGVVLPQLEEIAMRENGFVLALWGGIGIVAGALLPFIFHTQATADGVPVASGFGIGTGGRFISLFFGLLLAGMALSTRYRPLFRRRIAISSLILSLLGLAGYCLFTLLGVAGITVQTAFGPTQVSWYPNIGALDSIAGCAACAIAAIVMLRTPAPSETR
jgi:hypothetical protein